MKLKKIIQELKKKKTFTADELNSFCDKFGFVYTQCDNEKDGEVCEGVTTYQVATDEDEEYFGEFVGEDEIGIYEFVEYSE